MTDTYSIRYREHNTPDVVEADYIGEDKSVRISFWRRGTNLNENKCVFSVLSSEVLCFGLEEDSDDDLPAKPLVKYPEKLALFKVEFRDEDQADELIWAENAEFENGRPPVPLCGFYATLQTGSRSLLRSIWSDRIAEVTCIRPPESAA